MTGLVRGGGGASSAGPISGHLFLCTQPLACAVQVRLEPCATRVNLSLIGAVCVDCASELGRCRSTVLLLRLSGPECWCPRWQGGTRAYLWHVGLFTILWNHLFGMCQI